MKKNALLLTSILLLDLLLLCGCLSILRVNRHERGAWEAAEDRNVRTDRTDTKLPVPVSDDGVSGKSEGNGENGRMAAGERYLALTFDDGPHPEYTKKLLDGLRKRNIRASFFLVGENIEGNEELVRQMMEDGHLIGTHCYSHEDLTKKGAKDACMDIIRTNDMIEKITGKRPEYIRPPYGIWNDELGECIGMSPVFWDIDTLDWKSQNSGVILRHIEKNVEKHQIILLHDVFNPSVDAALSAIDTLTRQGYTFVTVDELLID